MAEGSFACAINCMDGRAQLPMIDYIKNSFGVDYVDMVTEPGPVKILTENQNQPLLDSIKVRLEISSQKHGAKTLVIAAHYDCAGNPVADEIQIAALKDAAKTISDWNLFEKIVLVWINKDWQIEVKE